MVSQIMLSGPMTSRRRMTMASSWKLKTTLRRKKSLVSVPSPAFARAGPRLREGRPPPSRGQAPAFARAGPRLREGRPPPSRGQALEPVDRLAVALAVGAVHRGEQVGRPRQLELHDGHLEAGMTLEDAGEDQIAQRQRRLKRLWRAAAGVAQRSGTGAADLSLPPRGRVQT